MNICFNINCNKWGGPYSGPPRGYVLLAYSGPRPSPRCESCGAVMGWHDNWIKDERTHDDGTKVEE